MKLLLVKNVRSKNLKAFLEDINDDFTLECTNVNQKRAKIDEVILKGLNLCLRCHK